MFFSSVVLQMYEHLLCAQGAAVGYSSALVAGMCMSNYCVLKAPLWDTAAL